MKTYGFTIWNNLWWGPQNGKNEWHKTRAKVMCLSLLWRIRKTLPNES